MSQGQSVETSPQGPRSKDGRLRERSRSRKSDLNEDKKPPLAPKRPNASPTRFQDSPPRVGLNKFGSGSSMQSGVSGISISGESLDSWNRYYSPRKEHWFMYNHTTGEMFWEAKKVGDRWEQFMAPTGLVFYLNTVTGDVVFEPPVPRPEVDLSQRSNNASSKDLMKDMDDEDERDQHDIGVGDIADIPVNQMQSALLQHLEHNKIPKKYRFMWDPQTPGRISWDFFLIIPLLVYLSVVMPFKMCFAYESKPYTTMFMWELVIDIIFLFDIVLNFRTGYLDDHEELVMEPKKVAYNYITSWFALDVVSGIPFSVLDLGGISALSSLKALKSSRVLKALRILRFLKLTRLLKGTKFIQRVDRDTLDTIEDFMADPSFRSVMRLLRISFLISYTTHIMACVWVLVGRVGDIERAEYDDDDPQYPDNPFIWRDSPSSNWLMAGGFTYKDTEKKKYVRSIYLASYYFCITTMTSVGYGDIVPRNDHERAFCVVLEAIGGFVYAMVIASLTSVVTTMDSNQRIVSERLDAVSSYVKNRRFPRHLGRRLRRYFRHFYSQKTAIDEQVILGDLSTSLRMEVSSFLVSGLMGQIPMFKSLNPQMWSKILPLLRPSRFERLECICKQGELCTEMFIVLDGTLKGDTFIANYVLEGLDDAAQDPQGGLMDNFQLDKGEMKVETGSSVNLDSKDERGGLRNSRILELFDYENEENIDVKKKTSESTVITNDTGVNFVRRIGPGETVNILAVIKVWDKSIETVVADEPVQCYAISADPFFALFRESMELVDQMRERTIETMFQMIDDPEAPTEYGMPLIFLSKKATKQKELEYDLKLEARQEEMLRVKKTARQRLNHGGGGSNAASLHSML